MNHLAKAYSVSICLIFAMATPALAQQPPDTVTSDSLANTAMGTGALLNVKLDLNGCHNTATGENALYNDSSGSYNTATGVSALYGNWTGNNNTAIGFNAMYDNRSASNNTAIGYEALFSNDGSNSGAAINNTAVGSQAMNGNTEGYNNTAFGMQALYDNKTGAANAAQGAFALQSNTSGSRNTAIGNHSLQFSDGYQNIALGFESGFTLTSGSNNIDIGSAGGSATENNTIRIGATSATIGATTLIPQTATFIAGISGSQVTGAAVYVTSLGQLGVLASSERYKTDITPIGATAGKLQQLRPVSFHLKTDPSGTLQYGLIAEEVFKVFPELVIRDGSGKIQGVRYEELAPMLLSEVQQQQATISAQADEIRGLKQQQQEKFAAQSDQLNQLQQQFAQLQDMNHQMQGALEALQSKRSAVAMR